MDERAGGDYRGRAQSLVVETFVEKMSKFRFAFFFGAMLVIVIAIARCNSRSRSSAETKTSAAAPTPQVNSTVLYPSPNPSSPSSQTPITQTNQTFSPEFRKVADQIGPAVVAVSVFDSAGRRRRSGTGFFVSSNGRFVTSWSVVEHGANAVVKTSDGHIYNVAGILADANAVDLAVLKAEATTQVPFVPLKKVAVPETGTPIAVIGSPLARRENVVFEGTVSARRSDQSGDLIELSRPIPTESIGAPVVNQDGELVGVMTSQREQGASANAIRTLGTLEPLFAQAGRRTKARWPEGQDTASESPAAPSEAPARNQKIPLAGANGSSRLIYSPKPSYPSEARHSNFPLKGTGRFRLTFNANGEVLAVEIIESTRSQTLDNAATEALRRWKSTPGREWTATVPITFQP